MAEELSSTWEKIAAFVFGVVFVATMLVIALKYPNPTPSQYTTFRIVLALACAGIASVIPGVLNVQVGKVVRAGGAIAVFVIIYFYSPARLVSTSFLRSNPPGIDYGLGGTEQNVTLQAEGNDSFHWMFLENGHLSVTPKSGDVSIERPQLLTVILNRTGLPPGSINEVLQLNYLSTDKTSHKLGIPVRALVAETLSYQFVSADDRLEVWINGIKIDESSSSSLWRDVPQSSLHVGKNILDLLVYNAATRRGLFGPREGWNYDFKVRLGTSEKEYTEHSADEPPVSQWGTTFKVKTVIVTIDAGTGLLSSTA